MNKTALPLAATVVACASLCATSTASETVLVIGDSLSREYQFEFPVFEDARNWVEILAENRDEEFDFGTKRPTQRYEHNWSIPTYSAESFADLVTGGGVFEELYQDQLDDDFDEVNSVVIFLGGNDIDSRYGPIYNGNQSSTNGIIQRIEDDLEDIIDFVQDDTPDMRMILVNVPHVGATPEVKGDHPTDPVKTGRVTAALQTLNQNLRDLADEKDIGYADIFTFVTELLPADPYCIGGYPFVNEGDDDGEADHLWLGGDLSQNFHPNTNGQALVANQIIAAYNEKYDIGATPFTPTEIVEDLVGLETPLTTWAKSNNLPQSQRAPEDDPDGDGLSNLIEFALSLNPGTHSTLPLPQITEGNLTYEYQTSSESCIETTPEFTTDLTTWFPVPAENLTQLPNSTTRITLPNSTGRTFIRLRVTLR